LKTQTPKYFKDKFKAIMAQVDTLEKQDKFTARDVAISQELCRQYSDVLREMEDTKIILDATVTAQVGDKLITFENTKGFTNWIGGILHG